MLRISMLFLSFHKTGFQPQILDAWGQKFLNKNVSVNFLTAQNLAEKDALTSPCSPCNEATGGGGQINMLANALITNHCIIKHINTLGN